MEKIDWTGCPYNFKLHKEYIDTHEDDRAEKFMRYSEFRYHWSRVERCYDWAYKRGYDWFYE